MVLMVKNTTRAIPKVRVMRHFIHGTIINMLVNEMNNETVETSSVGEIEIRYSGSVVRLIYSPETPTPRRISDVQRNLKIDST